MSAENNKAILRRLFEDVWNKHDLGAAKEIVSEGYRSSDSSISFKGAAGTKALGMEMANLDSEFSELHFEVEEIFSEKDLVIVILNASGTSKSETFINRAGGETPKKLLAKCVSVNRVVDGKIVASEFYWPPRRLFP